MGEELEFSALRPHQYHAWHAFLVQLGALVAHRTGRHELDLSVDSWKDALVELSGGSELAWSLAVDDLSRPAFLQPPVPEGSLSGFKKAWEEPDSLDVLVTAKNHDEKRERIVDPQPDHWVYALVTLQTMEGFLGRGNYGIVRMNGGFSSRPCVGLAPGLSWSARFRRDVAVWLDQRAELLERYGYAATGGHSLLWILPWDGTTGIGLRSCDPFFIEACRRIRLTRADSGRLVARATNTAGPRIDAPEQYGDTGDAWTPVASDGKALTVGSGGFTYRRLVDLILSGEYKQRPALEPRELDGERPLVIALALVRGQGKTDGYHQRLVPVPEKVKLRLGSVAERAALGELAQARVQRAGDAERRVLHPALCALLQGGNDELKLNDPRTRPWLDRLDRRIDAIFFEQLWSDMDRPDRDSRWDRVLFQLSREELECAIEEAPTPLARQPRAVARAELMFYGLARRYLGEALASDAAAESESRPPEELTR